jgi:anti-sigma B factor antagonist
VPHTVHSAIAVRGLTQGVSDVSQDPDFQIWVSEEDGTAVVHVAGEIDLSVRAELSRMLAQACAGGRDLVVDVSRTTFMDSAGLHALVTARRSQTAAGRSFVLRNPSASVRGMLTMAGLEEWFPIESGPES